MIESYAFADLTVAVFGLGPEGQASARSLMAGNADVWAWDDNEDKRADAGDIPLRDLNRIDWREPITLVIAHTIVHGKAAPHPIVAAARAAGCEVIADSELLARAQRDAGFIALVSRRANSAALDLFERVLQVAGQEVEAGGDPARPLLDLHPLDTGAVYVLDMPPARADITVSITFDAAVFLDLGDGPWPPCANRKETIEASRWVFHRQTGPRGAIINVDDADGRKVFDEISARREQVTIPISGRSRVPGGVYVADGVLYDDIGGKAEAVTDLPKPEKGKGIDPLLAAAVYAAAVVINVPKHAAMASLRSAHLG